MSHKYFEIAPFNNTREWTERERVSMNEMGYSNDYLEKKKPRIGEWEKENQFLGLLIYLPNGRVYRGLSYQIWAFAACSSAILSGVTRVVIGHEGNNEKEFKSQLVDVLEEASKYSGYTPQRFFMNVPDRGCRETIAARIFGMYQDVKVKLEPVYTFENRAHSSTAQRLYDVNMDVLRAWQKDYHASKPAMVAVSGVTVIDSGIDAQAVGEQLGVPAAI